MQTTSFHRIALLGLALGAATLTAAYTYAQTSDDTASTTPEFHHHHDALLTPDERAELKKDYEDALANDPSLKATADSLKQQKEALHQQEEAFHQKLHEAILAEDSAAGPILDKLEAAHKKWHHHHFGGDTSEAPDSTSTSN